MADKPTRRIFIASPFPSSLEATQPTFTHAGRQRKEIIICKVSPRDDNLNADHALEDEFKVTIIDWGKAGWYPNSPGVFHRSLFPFVA